MSREDEERLKALMKQIPPDADVVQLYQSRSRPWRKTDTSKIHYVTFDDVLASAERKIMRMRGVDDGIRDPFVRGEGDTGRYSTSDPGEQYIPTSGDALRDMEREAFNRMGYTKPPETDLSRKYPHAIDIGEITHRPDR